MGQADIVLLGFPLMFVTDSTVRRNDLNIYENVIRAGHDLPIFPSFRNNDNGCICNNIYSSVVCTILQ